MALPAVIAPCLPSPGEQPLTGPGWVLTVSLSIFNFTMLSYTSRTPSGFIEPCHPPGYYPLSLRDEMD